ncbi:GNAT family N-acetyltransferase [uncultured Rikenella sp.]|uniref:GNAT family N-acetyltransferase n=1 Tax=uncultured Rikenella sp. TaxID=368003 RepID=UPI002622083D|nr:GNAT family N-acetyltransferase [uncultured Rikenella sp.]
MLLQDDRIRLRALEPEDAEAMYRWENDTTLWRLGDTTRPFSRAAIREFIADASLDLYAARQMRLMIDLRATGETIGCADLFDFDPLHRRAGIGMLIYERKMRRQGFATAALQLLAEYAFGHLEMRQLWADIPLSNEASLQLFARAGFEDSGVKRAWIRAAEGTGYEDVRFVQLLRPER